MKPTDGFLHIDGIFTAFTSAPGKNFYFKGESHDFWEMVYVSEGKVGVSADDKVFCLGKGDIVFHKPNEFHRIWSAENTAPTYTVISFLLSGVGAGQFENLTLKANRSQLSVLDRLTECIRNNQPNPAQSLDFSGNTEPAYARFVCLLGLLLCEIAEGAAPLSEVKNENAAIFKSVVQYMENHLDGDFSVESFASLAGVSSSTLKRVFLEYSSLGVHGYFMQLKLRKAKELLGQGVPVCEVARQLGYSNQNYFSAAFKKATGCAPSKYR